MSYQNSTSFTNNVVFDQKLRAHMILIYNWMCSGLLLTAIISYVVSHTTLGELFYHTTQYSGRTRLDPTSLGFIAMLSPLVFSLVISFGFNRISREALIGLFFAFCAAIGISMASLFVVYTGSSIVSTFAITSAMFAGTSIFGYTTGADLSRMGSFLIMGLIGIILASILNIFIGSTLMNTLISFIGVFVFVGLTAWDTQKIKSDFIQNSDDVNLSKQGIMGAFSLYLNFINLFQFMLSLTGVRRDN